LPGLKPGPSVAPALTPAGPPPAAVADASADARSEGTGFSLGKRARAWLVGAPVATGLAIAAFMLWQSQKTPALTARDTVVLEEFRNRTNDPVFDDTLSEALAVQLRQSPFINLLSEQQTQATLRLMGRQPSDAVTPELALEVCQRAAAKATLGGTIAAIGSSYLVTLNARNCVDGDVVAEEQVEAPTKEAVIGALGQAASRFRERLGESLASVQRYDTKIEQATTSSLDALKAYSQGMATRRTKGDYDSVPFFRRAIEIDPKFAIAHARLGTVMANLGARAPAEEAATRAYELRSSVSERERLYIEARYHTTVARNQDKAIESYRLLLATYPDDYAAHTNLGIIYRNRGMVKEAIASLEEAVRVGPDQPLAHQNLGGAYLDDQRFPEARKTLERSIELQDSTGSRSGLYTVAIFTSDQALADKQVEAVRGRRDETNALGVQALAATYLGQMRKAEQLVDEIVERNQAAKQLRGGGDGLLGFAISQAQVGRMEAARAGLARVRKLDLLSDTTHEELIVLGALLGDRKLVEDNLGPGLESIRKVSSPEDAVLVERSLRSLVAFAEGRNQEAYDLAISVSENSSNSVFSQRNALFVAASAALRLKRWDDSIRLYRALVAFGSKLGLSPMLGTAYINLARAYTGGGQPAEAKKAYEEAFKIWKNADADMPLLVEARREYEKLGS
jgi:tetratricopeptide (TPR) repeat protein